MWYGIAFLRNKGIHVNIAYATSPNEVIFVRWADFYNWYKKYTDEHPEANFYIIGEADGTQHGTSFRIQWYGGGVQSANAKFSK